MRAGFDEQERGRVRRALRRYMAAHRIGTPALQLRIIEADVPRHREIPLSTLQRFLADRHWTSDTYVAIFQEFVSRLPQEPVRDEIAEFGDAFESFFPLRWPGPPGDTAAGRGPERFCGRYRGTAHTRILPKQMRVYRMDKLDPRDAVFVIPYAELTFTRDGHASYLRARETITNSSLDDTASQAQTRAVYTYEGVFVPFGPMLQLMLRNTLTRQPRLYELYEIENGDLRGKGREPSFASGKDEGGTDDVECLLRPITEGPEQ